jgi:hypothetical protein
MTIESDVGEAVGRILGKRASVEARRELRSHLLDAARERGSVGEAIRAAGGEAALARAFGGARFPATRGGRSALGGVLAVRALGAVVGLAAFVVALTRTGRASWPMALALVGVAAVLLAAACIVHVLRRDDLAARERWAWLVALLALEPVSGVAYLALGREGSRDLARRVLAGDGGSAS